MDCGQARHWMTAHLGGEDVTAIWRALRDHLEGCPACKAEAQAFATTWEALAALPDQEVPVGVWERIQARLPAPEPTPQAIPWPSIAGTAVAALLVSIAASWLLPYEQTVSLCSEALRRLSPSLAGLPDPVLSFAAGILYGLLPLGLAALVGARWLAGPSQRSGLLAGLVFGVLAVPYAVIACGTLPAAFTAALAAGILAGGLAGGPAGLWAGERLLAPART